MIFVHSIWATLEDNQINFHHNHICMPQKGHVLNEVWGFFDIRGKHFQTRRKAKVIVVFQEKRPIDSSRPFLGLIRRSWSSVRRLEENKRKFQTAIIHISLLILLLLIHIWYWWCFLLMSSADKQAAFCLKQQIPFLLHKKQFNIYLLDPRWFKITSLLLFKSPLPSYRVQM